MLRVQFINDGTGTKEVGNYDYKVFVNLKKIAEGRIEGHSRADGWQGLVLQFVDANLLKGDNDGR